MSMIKLDARGETFRISKVVGNLFVCAEENGGCCCGHVEKGRADVNKDLYAQLWEERKLRNKIHLTFVGCLGPCPVGNNAMLIIFGRAIWLKDLNDDRFIPMIFDYAEAMLNEGKVLPPTGDLASHVYERYLPRPNQEAMNFGQSDGRGGEAEMDFDGLDPVCMMTVDPATAEWRSDYKGKTYSFCAPSCKRSFDKDPAAYVGGKASEPQIEAAHDLNANAEGYSASTKTFVVPSISCDHCVRSIRNELAEITGLHSIEADASTRVVTVSRQPPAT